MRRWCNRFNPMGGSQCYRLKGSAACNECRGTRLMDSLGGHTRSYTGPGGVEQAPNGLSQSVIWGPPPSLQGLLVSDLRKHTLATYFKDHHGQPRVWVPDKIFGGSFSSKNRHLMSQAHMRVLKTSNDGFLLLNVGTTKWPRQIAAKAGGHSLSASD